MVKNFGIPAFWIFFLATTEIFSLTANPSDGKPCEPPCCEEIGDKRYYFCVVATVIYEVTCEAFCRNPEIGYDYYECSPTRILHNHCCYELNGYYVFNGCDNPAPLECFRDADNVDCYLLCEDETEGNRNCEIRKRDPRALKIIYDEQPKPLSIKEI